LEIVLEVIAIANPVGGSFNKKNFEKSIGIISSKIGKIKIIYTEYTGHATQIAKDSSADIYISAGGDGIINEIINGIEGKNSIFFPLPFGTANVFCKEHKIPLNPIKAAERVNFNNLKSIYLGKIEEKYFIQMLGFGFDAQAVQKVNLNIKKKYGKLAYILAGLKQFIINDTKKITFFVKGHKYEAYNAIFSIGRLYAGQFYLTKIKQPDKLLICYHQTKNRFSLIKTVVSMALKLGFNSDKLETDSVKITGSSICQIDGDLYKLKNDTNYIKIRKASFMLAH
jgi:diacylglycerol kinase family enzyme